MYLKIKKQVTSSKECLNIKNRLRHKSYHIYNTNCTSRAQISLSKCNIKSANVLLRAGEKQMEIQHKLG